MTPYVGLSIAEEYMREGYDVLVCIDDLKKHADSCREIALISGKNTGREAYPADIFYTHSRLLEKGCQYKNGGSITILPVVETKGGDITDYISTNIISITDGQIVLSEKNFKKGQKPALDFGLSVSRLGGAVQKDSIKKVGAAVRRELLTYLETADVYQLVKIDAMSKELQEKVFRGKKLLSLLCQPKFSPRSEEKLVSNFGFILEETSLANSDTQTTSNDPEILDMDRNVEEVNEVVEEQNVVQNVEAQVETPVVENIVEEPVQTPEVVNEWAPVEAPVVETVEEPVATFVPAEEQTSDGTVITDVEQLYTTEIPVEAIKQVLNEDIEQLRTTEIPVNEINEAAAEEEIEQLYTTEIPIIQQVEPFEIEENAVPVIEQSYTVEIPKLGTDYVTNTNETTTPEITFVYPDSNSDNNGVN